MPANYLALPFILLTLLFLYLGWEVDDAYSKWMVIPLVITAVIYVSAPQINWWWWQRNPPQLDASLKQLLERFHPFYRQLTTAEQAQFGTRVFLFRNAVDWQPVAWPEEELPSDVQLAIAAQSVMMTFRRKDYLFPKFEKVIVYPKPFLSPEYPFGHASELFEPDGCLIFSAEQVMQAFTQPQKNFDITLYEYARVFMRSYPAEAYPSFDDSAWEQLELISGMSRAYIESVIAIAGIQALPVAIHHYWIYPARFQQVFPAQFAGFQRVFGAA